LRSLSQTDTAKKLNVSPRSVTTATKVLNGTIPEIIQAVEKGHLSISAAEKIVDATPEDQSKIADLAANGTKKATADAIRLVLNSVQQEAVPETAADDSLPSVEQSLLEDSPDTDKRAQELCKMVQDSVKATDGFYNVFVEINSTNMLHDNVDLCRACSDALAGYKALYEILGTMLNPEVTSTVV